VSVAIIVLLHPGEMGAAVGKCLRTAGCRVLWIAEGRSAASTARAQTADLESRDTLPEALAIASHVISICPPRVCDPCRTQCRRLEVPRHLCRCQCGLTGDDTQNRSDRRSERRDLCRWWRHRATAHEVRPVPRVSLGRGGSWSRASVRPLTAGRNSSTGAHWRRVGAQDVLRRMEQIGPDVLTAVRAVAECEGVQDALLQEWRAPQPALAHRLDLAVANARKAWRWVGEMEQIAATFSAAGLPPGFPLAAAEVCHRLSALKDLPEVTLEQVITALAKVAVARNDSV
jgi:Domain of unknown function (DUF1932)